MDNEKLVMTRGVEPTRSPEHTSTRKLKGSKQRTVRGGSVTTKHTVSTQRHSRRGTNNAVRIVRLSRNDTSNVGTVTTTVERVWVREGGV